MRIHVSGAVEDLAAFDRLGIVGDWRASPGGQLPSLSTNDCLIWMYFPPWAQPSVDAPSDWMKLNREALAAKPVLGERMMILNGTAPTSALNRAFDRSSWVKAVPRETSVPEAQVMSDQILCCLMAFAAPSCFDVYAHLEAAADAPATPEGWHHLPGPDDVYLFSRQIQSLLSAARDICATAEGEPESCDGGALTERFHLMQEDAERLFLSNLQLQRDVQHVSRDRDTLKVEQEELRKQIARSEADAEALRKTVSSLVEARTTAIARADELELKLAQANQELLNATCLTHQMSVVDGWFRLNWWRRVAKFIPALRKKYSQIASQEAKRGALEIINSSNLLDKQWYLHRYPDVRASGMDPGEHYLEFGWREHRDPGPEFDTSFYVMSNLDVARSGVNPLLHFILHGRDEGRSPHPSGVMLSLAKGR